MNYNQKTNDYDLLGEKQTAIDNKYEQKTSDYDFLSE